jgi:hypothetical protein
LLDSLAAFEADLAEHEDDGDAEEEPDGEPSLGSLNNRMNQEQAWRGVSGAWWEVDREAEHDGREPDEDFEPDADLEPDNDAEIDAWGLYA